MRRELSGEDTVFIRSVLFDYSNRNNSVVYFQMVKEFRQLIDSGVVSIIEFRKAPEEPDQRWGRGVVEFRFLVALTSRERRNIASRLEDEFMPLEEWASSFADPDDLNYRRSMQKLGRA